MPSQLSRVVFRNLLTNEPIVYPGCLRRPSRLRPALQPRRCLQRPQRRGFFNIFSPPPTREALGASIDPGLEKLMELAKMERLNARLPPPEQVAQAFVKFFEYKRDRKEALEDVQAQYALQALSYLQAQHDEFLALPSLRHALSVLETRPRQPSGVHAQLAIALYDALSASNVRRDEKKFDMAFLESLTKALSRAGSPGVARDHLLASLQKTDVSDANSTGKSSTTSIPLACWKEILKAFKDQGNTSEFHQTIALMEEHRVPMTMSTVIFMAELSASADDIEGARQWYQRSMQPDVMHKGLKSTAQLQEILVHLCIRTSQVAFGQSIIKDMMSGTLTKLQWDLIFVWAAGIGKGVDEINRMMGVMEKANQDIEDEKLRCYPDASTINRLVELAISRNDPYTAERYITLGEKRQIQPNARTFTLQIDYRLSVNDVDGALVAYKHLQAQDVSDDEDLPSVNRLICAMCASGRQDFDSIMNVAADLSDRRAKFEAPTVSALSLLHLSRGEFEDVADLLNTHVFHLSGSDKASVRDVLVKFCTDTTTSTTKAWNTYAILKKIFDETSREQRSLLMNDFFRRGRADMAVHVFNHMRIHTREDVLPTIDTYVSCLAGIANVQDAESLEVVHNQLKLDDSIEPNTRLLNALILAYTACGVPRRALSFWDEIIQSREGPTLNSIHLALRACEDAPWGDEKARTIWARLKLTGLDLDQSLWASYAGGLVGNGKVDSAINDLEEAHDANQLEMSAFILGSLFNAAPGQSKQTDVEEWAKQRFPALWRELEDIGMRVSSDGMRHFRIDRHVDP
ncbi:hypothetical protein AAFC00_001216 [Neodothiora populina]|uniref:Complex I intermediate-associated protein 84 n=1 Tax=Neodothiora populina TaxID=2781224 RepID=A0ABR3PN56_9PEZI